MQVHKLTEEQKELLIGQAYGNNSYFNPIKDGNEPPNWIISTQEVKECTNPVFYWVKELP